MAGEDGEEGRGVERVRLYESAHTFRSEQVEAIRNHEQANRLNDQGEF